MNELELRREAARITRLALDKASGRKPPVAHSERPVCLIEHRAHRGDVPDGTLLIRMSWDVASRLHEVGLREPVSLTHLKDRWWVAQVDAAHIHANLEFGGAYCTVVASTDELLHRYTGGFVEVVQGPFNSRQQALDARDSP